MQTISADLFYLVVLGIVTYFISREWVLKHNRGKYNEKIDTTKQILKDLRLVYLTLGLPAIIHMLFF